jgi:hypothetical protein
VVWNEDAARRRAEEMAALQYSFIMEEKPLRFPQRSPRTRIFRAYEVGGEEAELESRDMSVEAQDPRKRRRPIYEYELADLEELGLTERNRRGGFNTGNRAGAKRVINYPKYREDGGPFENYQNRNLSAPSSRSRAYQGRHPASASASKAPGYYAPERVSPTQAPSANLPPSPNRAPKKEKIQVFSVEPQTQLLPQEVSVLEAADPAGDSAADHKKKRKGKKLGRKLASMIFFNDDNPGPKRNFKWVDE